MTRVLLVTVLMSKPSLTRYWNPPSESSSVAAATETGPMPSISQNSSPSVVPRRSDSALMMIRS